MSRYLINIVFVWLLSVFTTEYTRKEDVVLNCKFIFFKADSVFSDSTRKNHVLIIDLRLNKHYDKVSYDYYYANVTLDIETQDIFENPDLGPLFSNINPNKWPTLNYKEEVYEKKIISYRYDILGNTAQFSLFNFYKDVFINVSFLKLNQLQTCEALNRDVKFFKEIEVETDYISDLIGIITVGNKWYDSVFLWLGVSMFVVFVVLIIAMYAVLNYNVGNNNNK
eukprot:GAHX01000798.1.p1 GENE.GAHX01000798.1~~GAHX01000798.1.p1  ORF type:complete len:224 (-),score=37.56 GAHX01000798.1:14-685(-)